MKVQKLLSLLDSSRLYESYEHFRRVFEVTAKNVDFINDNIYDVEDIKGNVLDSVKIGDKVRLTAEVARALEKDENKFFGVRIWPELFEQLKDRALQLMWPWFYKEFSELVDYGVAIDIIEMNDKWKWKVVLQVGKSEIPIFTLKLDINELKNLVNVWFYDERSPYRLTDIEIDVIKTYMAYEYISVEIELLKTKAEVRKKFPEFLERLKKVYQKKKSG